MHAPVIKKSGSRRTHRPGLRIVPGPVQHNRTRPVRLDDVDFSLRSSPPPLRCRQRESAARVSLRILSTARCRVALKRCASSVISWLETALQLLRVVTGRMDRVNPSAKSTGSHRRRSSLKTPPLEIGLTMTVFDASASREAHRGAYEAELHGVLLWDLNAAPPR